MLTKYFMRGINIQKYRGGGPHGVMVKAIDCGVVVHEFVLQSCYYIHFGIKQPIKVDMPLNKETKPNQKYSNVFLEEHVFSHVDCLSLLGFDEISEAVFEPGTSLTELVEQVRKRLQNVYAPMLRVLSCVLLSGKVKLFLEVEMKRERECCLWKLKCESLEDESIYRQSLSCGRLQKRGIKSKVWT